MIYLKNYGEIMSNTKNTDKEEKVYSLNSEEFEDYDAIISQLEDEYLPGEKVTIYEGTAKNYSHSDFFDIYKLISAMQEKAYDEVGDYAEEYFDDITPKKIEKFNKLIVNWLNKNIKEPKFCSVENIKEIEITI